MRRRRPSTCKLSFMNSSLIKYNTDDYCHVCLSDNNLWETLDRDASEARTSKNATADATVEVQRYMTDPPLGRSEDSSDLPSGGRTMFFRARSFIQETKQRRVQSTYRSFGITLPSLQKTPCLLDEPSKCLPTFV